MNFSELSNYLSSWIKVLPPSLAEQIVNQARQDIYDSHNWSFLFGEGYIRTPKIINSGTASVTKYSNLVILDATAKALVDAIAVEEVSLLERQFRTLSNETQTGIKIYSIIDYDSGTGTLTLDDIYYGPTSASAKYEILKSYYNPPKIRIGSDDVFDFKSFIFVIDLVQNRRLYVDKSSNFLGQISWDRLQKGTPYYVFPYKLGADNEPLFEFFPAPIQDRIYKVIYKRKGQPLTEEENLPTIIPDELLLLRAKYYVYEWCEVNKGTFPELRGTSWTNLRALLMNFNDENAYPQKLQQAKKADEELFPQAESYGSYNSFPYYDSILGESDLMSPFQPPNETLIINY